MTEVIVTNPALSAGHKLGIVVSCLLFACIFLIIYSLGKPRK